MSNILVAVAWPYANGPRHIGHVAGFGIPSDIFARYMRMQGHNVLMVSGTDEHGTPILVQSEEANKQPQEIADKYNRVIVEDLVKLGLSYDLFTRTTAVNHHQTVQSMFKNIYDNGYMVTKIMKSAISPSTGRTLPDRYIEGICPICKSPGARGDQCDKCGNQLDPIDLIDPKSKINGETPDFIDTEHFFLDLPKLKNALTNWLQTKQNWRSPVINFSLNLLEKMQARAMTRDIDWGIRIPVEGWMDNDHKRLYVWFDAVIGYLSASIEWARRFGENDAWRVFWNDESAKSYYFMGKDNIAFHSQIWPAELLAYNGEGELGGSTGEFGKLNLPTEVVASEFLTMENQKFSSSKGIVIYVRDMLEKYQTDALRYYIAIAGPETHDANFTFEDFYARNNNELIAAWGNLVNRVLNLAFKNFGEIPAIDPNNLEEIDVDLLAKIRAGFEEVGNMLEVHKQKDAIRHLMSLVQLANGYITQTAPWALKEPDQMPRLKIILHTALQAISDLNIMFAPFLIDSTEKIYKTLGFSGNLIALPKIEEVHDLDDSSKSYPIITGDYELGVNVQKWESKPIISGVKISKPEPLFSKLDPLEIETKLETFKK